MKKLNELQSYLTRLRGLMLTLIILCSIGSGNVWGTNTTTSSDPAPAGTYTAMVSGEAVVAGDTIIIVCETSGKAMSTTQNSNNRGSVTVTISNSSPKTVTLNGTTTAQALRVAASANSGWTLYTGVGYLYAPSYNSGNSNYLRTDDTGKDGSGGNWTIAYNSVVAAGSGTRRYIRRNGDLISCYSSGAQTEIQVYKKAHSVTYKGNGGTTSCSHASLFKSNETVTICATEPTRAGYNFTGWTANVNLVNASTSATITAGTLIAASTQIKMPPQHVVLTAQWESAAPVSPAKTVYLKPNGIWNKDGARFAIYYWKSSDGDANGWLDMSTYCGPNYTVTVPEGYDKFQFCRMDGAKATNNWSNVWNRTPDLDKPTTNDVYTIEYIDGDAYHNSTGSWGTYTCPDPTTIYLNPNSIWDADGARYAAYYWEGDDSHWVDFEAACGAVTAVIPSGYTNIILCRMNGATATNNWDNKWNQTTDQVTTGHNNYVFTISSINGCTDGKSCGAWTVYSVPTYTISYAKGSTTYTGGATISGSKSNETKTCGVDFTLPSSAVFSATGYTQTGWSTSDDGTQDYVLGGSYTTNAAQTFYPAWTVKTTTVSFDQNSGTGGQTTSKTATYGSAMPTPITCPTREGYDFGGYYDGTGGTGTKYYNADGTSAKNWDKEDASYTLHAKWTIKSYTINWYVGGSAEGNKLTTGSQTANVNHGGKVTTLPTSSQTSIDCDDKTFVGWTNTTSYTHGTSLLFTDAAGSPTITEATNFYAVFAAEGGSSEPTNKFSVTLNVATPSVPSGYTLSQATEWKNSTHRQDGSNDPAYIKVYHTSTKLFSSLPSTITIKAGLYGGSARDMSEDGSDYYPYVFFTDNSGNEIAGSAKAICTSVTNSSVEKSVDMDVSKATNAYGIGIRHKKISSFNLRYSSITLTYAESSYTGHTINCTSCANSVTVSYSDPGSGNTMSVTKGSTPIASGSSVKTCSAQSLTVTLTPATHYTVTNFAATGVTGVTTTNVGNVYTVNIPADKTGTLTLTPTFTPETPLTITLDTKGKGTYTDPAEWPIYAGESFTLPDVTPSDPTCATFVGWIQGETFPGDGTTHDAPSTISAGSSSGALSVSTTYTAVFYETETAESDAYVKVTSAPANWANDHYLIVYESGELAFDGSRTDEDGDKIDAANNTVAVNITSGAIAATNALAASEWKIALISGSNYSIQSASGKYIGNAANSNALTTSAEALANTLSISSGDFGVVSAGGAYLRYNATSGQERFRYYKSSSYTSQQAIQLYKLGTAVVETRTYTTNPACTPKYRVTVASVTVGSPNANPKFLPENEEVTLTANPAAGYSFTSWTITKTTGGDDVTTTLLGANATTANTSFSMPAYDVTVTASFAKKVVSELKVMDGSTVVANTTGSVSGTLNVSTGANKTLDVVITPADAFDHSWTASVTAGGTYASISNVTDAGFRVNGLAQGDATVTVTAPNDGSAKVVTFTVHVTDILPEEIILKRDGSETPINALTIYLDQYAKINVSYSPTPTDKTFTFSSADATSVSSHAHAPASGYETLHGLKVTSSPVNCTFTSAATSSVTKVLAVTVLALPADQFIDYIHGNATVTRAAQVSADHWSINTSITTPTLSDAAESASADCEAGHYHLIGWLPQSIAEALFAAGTPITSATEGLVAAGAEIEASGITWYAIWAKKE